MGLNAELIILSVKAMFHVFYTMTRLECEVVEMNSLFPETRGDDNVVNFTQYHFVDVSRSCVIVPAGARMTHISAMIDGNEVCRAPLNMHSPRLHTYELRALHPYFSNIPLMYSVPMSIKITASAPIRVEALCMYFTGRVALKLFPYARRMSDENGGRVMPTPEELHKLLQ